MISDVDAAWAAGFYEGEGCASINRPRGVPHLRITITQVNREPLERLLALFGGCITRKSKEQECWLWQASGRRAELFAETIWRWLSDRRRAQIEKARATVAQYEGPRRAARCGGW